jgi:hypothetical protein
MRKCKKIPLPLDAKVLERFWARVDKNGPTCAFHPALGPCWMWTGQRQKNGYGVFDLRGEPSSASKRRGRKTPFRAHRIAYAIENGDFLDGMETDHKCENRSCVRASHLESVTSRVNNLRGRGPSAANHRKTHCKRGHLLSKPEPGKKRNCRECHAIRRAATPQERLNPRKHPLTCAYCGVPFMGTPAAKWRTARGIRPSCCQSHASKLKFAEGRGGGVQLSVEANAAKTVCSKGHPLSGSNLHLKKGSGGYLRRCCLTCERENLARLVSKRTQIPASDGAESSGKALAAKP